MFFICWNNWSGDFISCWVFPFLTSVWHHQPLSQIWISWWWIWHWLLQVSGLPDNAWTPCTNNSRLGTVFKWLDRPIQNKGRLEGINVGADVCKYVDAFPFSCWWNRKVIYADYSCRDVCFVWDLMLIVIVKQIMVYICAALQFSV